MKKWNSWSFFVYLADKGKTVEPLMWKFEILIFLSLNLADKGRTNLQASFRILIRKEVRKLDFCEKLMERDIDFKI